MAKAKKRAARGSRGNIRERGPGVWQVKIMADVVQPDGSIVRKPVYSSIRGTRRDAELHQARLKLQRGEISTGDIGDLTVGEAVDLYLQSKDMSPKTRRENISRARNKLSPEFRNIKVTNLSRASIDSFYGHRKSQGDSPDVVLSLHQLLRAAVNYATDDGELLRNPFSSMKMKRIGALAVVAAMALVACGSDDATVNEPAVEVDDAGDDDVMRLAGSEVKVINGCRIEPGTQCPRADLRRADLTGADLVYAYLSGADLTGANLWGANLSGANLRGANLRGVNLPYADLSGADLSGVNLSNASLWGADLSGANLSDAALWGAYLRGANLSNANLSGGDLRCFEHPVCR